MTQPDGPRRRLDSNRVVVAFVVITTIASLACVSGNTRGWWEQSPDGKTYLVIEDDNKTACSRIEIDGKTWNHSVHERGSIKPGIHTIRCGGEMKFEVPAGVIFHFDYWGP